MSESIIEYTKQINQEIKDKKLTSKDTEYFRLKMRLCYERLLKPKSNCPTCNKLLSYRVLHYRHKCKMAIKPESEIVNKV